MAQEKKSRNVGYVRFDSDRACSNYPSSAMPSAKHVEIILDRPGKNRNENNIFISPFELSHVKGNSYAKTFCKTSKNHF